MARPLGVPLGTPPMTQLNTPYPATAYLTGCLRTHAAGQVEVAQADFSLELFLRLFSREGLRAVERELAAGRKGTGKGKSKGSPGDRTGPSASVAAFLARADDYIALVEPVLHFLQGRDSSLAM